MQRRSVLKTVGTTGLLAVTGTGSSLAAHTDAGFDATTMTLDVDGETREFDVSDVDLATTDEVTVDVDGRTESVTVSDCCIVECCGCACYCCLCGGHNC